MSETTTPAIRPGYFRDHDAWLYATPDGGLYMVEAPGEPEPVWRLIDPPILSDDAEPRTPGPDDLESFERARVAYGIEG